VATLVFIDGNDFRRAELAQILAGVEVRLEALTAGFATSAPEPAQKARDKVAAHVVSGAEGASFAEAVDLTTMDGKSLRLELDSENETRFCKWLRETPAKMQLRVAYRRANGEAIEVLSATCDGRIADKPVGPLILGWDRLFVPDGPDGEDGDTLAQLSAAGHVAEFRRAAYGELARALGL
jgi:inosine/xanthosine triphosphate pyrophosphatase family protein